ncbi:MAG TPA: hypothetical protein H9986_04145 [Candidatus Prevotella stercoripullorum]|nr:hypothetical protein [Candidatus Prevotella stercoripullorum]
MKRLFLTVVAVLSMTMTFADNEKLNNTESANAYNMEVNYGKLADCLGLSIDQAEAVQDIHTSFCADMMNAAGANADERDAMVKKAVEKDLKYMRSVLTEDQYRSYLRLLNATFTNRGLMK